MDHLTPMNQNQCGDSLEGSAGPLFRPNKFSQNIPVPNGTKRRIKDAVLSNLKFLLLTWGLVLARPGIAAETPGTITFNTRVSGVVDAKVSRPDGSGAGAGVQAQLFLAGPDGSLIGLTPATTFRMDSDATSYYVTPVTVAVPSAAPGQQVTLRMRAWAGTSFENSTLRGESAAFSVVLGGD
jgi:hypothetical protein